MSEQGDYVIAGGGVMSEVTKYKVGGSVGSFFWVERDHNHIK
jgi:hypothetical protein